MRTRSGVSTHRVDVIVLERGVEGRREAELAVDLADDGLVTGLDGEDGAGGGEVVLQPISPNLSTARTLFEMSLAAPR